MLLRGSADRAGKARRLPARSRPGERGRRQERPKEKSEHARDRDRYSNAVAGEICATEDDHKHKPKPLPTVLTGTELYLRSHA